MPLGVGEQFAGYTVVRLLGSGGMGEVYLAQHPRLPRRDALKVLPAAISHDSDFRMRFEREADLAATLWHPHIVGVHDRGEFEGRLWISMDYVEGSDAARLSREQFPQGMPARDVAGLAVAVAEALDYAHEQQLLHRDVKPGNILLTETSRARRRILLADFGIARQADDVSGLTATNMAVGSVSYTAPEQLMGEPIDGRADQYSLAATTYHLLTGAPPFSHSNSAVVISRHLSTPPPLAADVRPELGPLDAVLTRAMAKDPGERFATCVEFAEALREGANLTSQDGEGTVVARPVVRPSEPVSGEVLYEHDASSPDSEPTVQHAAPPSVVSTWGAPPPEPAPSQVSAAPAAPLAGSHPPVGVGRDPERPGRDPRKVGIAAIGGAVVILAMITGVVEMFGGGDEDGTRTGSSSRTTWASPSHDTSTQAPSSTSQPTRTTASRTSGPPPGLIRTPDAYQEQCSDGVSMSGEGGWAARGGRGTTETSCYFAYSVLRAYWDRYPTPSRDLRRVIAEGRVACDPSAAQCAGEDYVMQCEAIGADSWITCTGGRNARVYLF